MSARSTSIAARAAWAAFVSAALSGAFAALVASVLADLFVLRQTDRHLVTAAQELTREIGAASPQESLASIVEDEQREVTSTGIRLAVHEAGRASVGDPNVPRVAAGECATNARLRVCAVAVDSTRQVVAGTLRETSSSAVAIAAIAAAAFAGCIAWGLARVLSRRAVAPLVRLQTRIAELPLDRATRASRHSLLGADEGIVEIDALRRVLETLLARMHDAIERSTNFAANAAHELRTPLTALRGELELVSEAAVTDEDGARAVAVARRKVAHVQALIERLLVLATPEDDAPPEDDGFTMVSLRDVIDEVVAELPTEDAARVVVAEGVDAYVRGEPTTLGMLVSNGISNALKFGTRARVEIGVGEGAGRAHLAHLAIEDDGPGIPAEDRARLFEPFARGDGAKRVPGHGLGLALVAHVAKRHRGEARLVEPHHGDRGIRLEITLPLARAASTSEAPTSKAGGAPTSEAPRD